MENNSWLIFIDTNILLDFYRIKNDASVSLLNKIDQVHASIITTYIVEMEFRKNRLEVLREAVTALKTSETPIDIPAFLKEAKAVEMIKSNRKAINKQIERLKKRVEAAISTPATKDPVYQSVQRLFSSEKALHLKYDADIRKRIIDDAQLRYNQGMPPRKDKALTLGDSINWEWILYCAQNSEKNVIVVSRDSDYGSSIQGKCHINDWLGTEFKKIVKKRRNVILVDKLSSALSKIEVELSDEEKNVENILICPRLQQLGVRLADRPVLFQLYHEIAKDKRARELLDEVMYELISAGRSVDQVAEMLNVRMFQRVSRNECLKFE